MNINQQKIESLLFYRNEPTSLSWLSKKLKLSKSDIQSEIDDMFTYYEGRGITLLQSPAGLNLMTAAVSSALIEDIAHAENQQELSKQALETLAIIAYRGILSKVELDYIRGVNSVFMLRNLLIRGLIEKKVNPEDRRTSLYSITEETMSFLGIQKIEELPGHSELHKKLQEIEEQREREGEVIESQPNAKDDSEHGTI